MYVNFVTCTHKIELSIRELTQNLDISSTKYDFESKKWSNKLTNCR